MRSPRDKGTCARRRRRALRACALAAVAAAALGVYGSQATGSAPVASTLDVSADGRQASVSVDSAAGIAIAPEAPFAEGRVIVRFRDNPAFLPGSGHSVALAPQQRIFLVDNPAGVGVAEAIARYRSNPNVEYVEPDYTVTATATPNDPLYAANQWDMAKIAAPQAWDVDTDASGVVVAVIDTGIAYGHPDLAANLWSSPGDATVHGYTCTNGACVAGGLDDHGHGTHVAGTIAAATNNGVGVAGINWTARLLSIKFLSSSGSGSISDAVLGFNLLQTLKQSGVPIRVTNNSWGGGGYSQALKDAMAALEQTPGLPGTLNVCAAGNSGVNADFTPMYPAAYDNRGIVSVLASDSNDVGASFTNYGMMSVDIAAPGVSIYSTEATGTCSLCDPSGYRTLSGTSMASPHVAGVAAALIDRNRSLTAAQARDALLDPRSYDAVTDARARWTSTGGRLNMLKALTNTAYLSNPVLDGFPTVTVGPDVFTQAGGTVNFTQTSSDPDGDTLRSATGRGPVSSRSAWLFGWAANRAFPSSVPFTAPALARTAVMPYDTAVADNRGGGSAGRNWAVVSPGASAGGAPTGVLTVPATGTINVPVTVGFTATDPEGGTVGWELWASGMRGSSGVCCYTGTTASVTFSSAGVYRIAVQAIDAELNTSPVYSAVVSIDGATGTPPIAAATIDTLSGTAPLTVQVDMSASVDLDGKISTYFIDCANGYASGQSSPTGSCTFNQPGTYWLLLQVSDTSGYMGLVSRYVVVTPPPPTSAAPPIAAPPPDTSAPTVAFASPDAGASLTGTVGLSASAGDETGGSGLKEVEYYLDSISATTSLGKSTVSPYTVNWDSTLATPGGHTLYAVARDNAGNASTGASRSVTTYIVLPTVSLSPSGTVTVAKRTFLAMSASLTNSPTFPVSRVDFVVGTSVVCSDTVAPYQCSWKAPNAAKTYQAQARAYDSRGNSGVSSILTITVR